MISYNSPVLNIIYWNANSILSDIHELYDLMNVLSVQVCCVSETCLSDDDVVPSHRDFYFHRLSRQTHHERASGGVGIIFRRTLKHRLLNSPNTKLLECIGIRLETNRGSIDIYSVYLPGGADNNSIHEHYKNDLQILTRRPNCFIMGDFNSKHRSWNCTRSNIAGRILFDAQMTGNFMIYFPPEPTHFPYAANCSPSTIDLLLSTSNQQISDLVTHPSPSDHQFVSFSIYLENELEIRPQRSIPLYSQANWEQFRLFIHFELAEDIRRAGSTRLVHSTDEIDALVEKLTITIDTARRHCIPVINPSSYALNLTSEVKVKITERNRLRRFSQRNPHYHRTIEPLIRQMQEEIREDVKTIRNNEFARRLESIPDNDQTGKVWKIKKMLMRRREIMPPLKDDQNRIHLTPPERCDLLAQQFMKNYDNPLKTDNAANTRRVKNRVTRYIRHCIVEPEYASVQEVREEIQRLKNNTSPGFDNIHSRLIKNLPDTALWLLLIIINSSLRLSYFPKSWKHSKMMAIKKPEKPSNKAASYRPISLLSVLSKICERIVLKRVKEYLEAHNVIPECQHGFRANHSTTTQLDKMTEELKHNLFSRQSTGVVFMDIEKAFDRVWIDGLLFKLIDIRMPAYIIKFLSNYLRDRSFQVHLMGHSSDTYFPEFGLPQGAVLSPVLYTVFTYDQPQLTDPDTYADLFADDTSVRSSSRYFKTIKRRLENTTKKYLRYFKLWKISANPEKFKAIFITKRRTKQTPTQPLRFGDFEVNWDECGKHLGLTIDKRMTLKTHIDQVLNKSLRAVRAIYSLIGRRSRLNTNIKMRLYKTAIRPIFSYAAPIISRAAPSHIKRLQRFQNKTLRMILDIRWDEQTQRYTLTTADTHDIAGIEEVLIYLNKLTERYHMRTLTG